MESYGGVPVWHASAAVLGQHALVSVVDWTAKERADVEQLLLRAIRRVGNPAVEWHDEGPHARHVRRRINDEELRVIGPARDVRHLRTRKLEGT